MKWTSIYCALCFGSILLAFGCSRYKRSESVQSRVITEEIVDHPGRVLKRYYQEFDKNDSLVYEEYFGQDLESGKQPQSIENRYFEKGKLVREKINTSYKKIPHIINVFYRDHSIVRDFGGGDLQINYFDNQERLIREDHIWNQKLQWYRLFAYKEGNRLPDIKEYWKSRLWSLKSNRCYGDTCITFTQDSTLAIVDMSLSIYHSNKLYAVYFNDPMPPGWNHHDTAAHSPSQFKNYTLNTYDHKGRIQDKKKYYDGKLYNIIRYWWDR